MDLKKDIQRCLLQIVRSNAFIGALLQEMSFKFDNFSCPTAGIHFNQKTSKFELLVNTDFFEKLEQKAKVAVLMHEILHFLHNHLFRFQKLNVTNENRIYWNIAADMAINQYIKNLPEGTIDVNTFKRADGSLFPKFKTMEEYYDLIEQNRDGKESKGQNLTDSKGTPKKDKHGNPIVDKNGKPFQNEDGTPKQGTGNEGPNKEQLDKYEPFDEHNWENLSDDEKERMAREIKKVIQRTIEKTNYSHNSVPGYIKDFLEEINTHLQKFNYKAILKQAIKKTAMAQDRESSWKRPSKRYGDYAPGTTVTQIPKLNMYVDTSGSISYRELNEFLDIIDGFLKQGTKTCSLILWHTDIYYNKRYKLKSRLEQKEIQGGGTDPDPVLKEIKKTMPELAIILTDGYFSPTRVDVKSVAKNIIWIISANGTMEHPNKHIGKTISMKGLI